MFENLVTHHIHKHDSAPAKGLLACQYVLAGNDLHRVWPVAEVLYQFHYHGCSVPVKKQTQ